MKNVLGDKTPKNEFSFDSYEEEEEEEEEEKETPETKKEKQAPKKPEGDTSAKKTGEETDKEKLSLQARLKHNRKKREQAEANLKEKEEELAKLKGKAEKKEESKLTDDEWKQKVDFALINSEASKNKEFMDTLLYYARGKGIPLSEAFKSDVVQMTWKSVQEKVAKESKVPSPSSRSKKEGEKPFYELSKKERKEKYPEIVERQMSRAKEKAKEME